MARLLRALPIAFVLQTGCGSSDVAAILALEGDAANGAALFANNCAGCHGDNGRSGSVGEDIASESDEEIVETMLTGEGVEMPSFADTLTAQELADLLAFVQTL